MVIGNLKFIDNLVVDVCNKLTFDKKEYNRVWYKNNLEKRKEYEKIYREKHQDETKEYNKIYREKHPEYQKIWYKEHLNEVKEYKRIWREEHSDEEKDQQQIYREEHRDVLREKNRAYLRTLHLDAIRILSFGTNKCMWEGCGEDRIDGLTVDHIHGGDNKHKKEINRSFYLWLKQSNYPTDDYQVLCTNHQMEKAMINGEYNLIKTPTYEQQKRRDIMQRYIGKLKFQTLSAYSNSPIPFCKICHTTNIYHLCLDHIHGDGAEDRRKYGCRGTFFYTKLRQLGYPDKDMYQVLCYTCNQIKKIQNGENVGRKIIQ